MTRLLILLAAAASTTLLTACPLAPGCGAYQGGGDKVFRNAVNDSAIQCENGGFILNSASGTTTEGRVVGNGVQDGATGAFAFDWFVETSSGSDGTTITTAVSQTLGGDWSAADMNYVELDHADQFCQELATRAWWSTTATLPVTTAFSKPAEPYATVADCLAAEPTSTCEDVLLLCPNGTAELATAYGTIESGTYDATGGQIGVTTATWGLSGTYEHASLATFGLETNVHVTWRTVAPDSVSLHCL